MNRIKNYLSNLKLGHKLIIAFLLVGIIPLAISSYMFVNKASDALSKTAFNQLGAVRNIKTEQIQRFFAERKGDMGVLMQTVGAMTDEAFKKLSAIQELKRSFIEDYIAELYNQVKVLKFDPLVLKALIECDEVFELYDDRVDTPQWQATAERYDHRFKEMMADNHWYDIFLIHKNGGIVYTAARESDLGMIIPDSELKNSGLGKAFERIKSMGAEDIVIADFEPYSPSGGQQAAFMMAQLRDNRGDLQGYVAIQMPTDKINAMMQQRAGMGISGESYLVGKNGGKTSFRSDMKTMGDGKYVIGYPIATPYVEAAIGGKSGQDIFTDSRGNLVATAYDHLKIKGLDWACVSKINLAEAIVHKDQGSDKDFFVRYIEAYGYYDLFLIHPKGKVFYSATHEADFGTNMVDGKYANSGLGKLTRRVLQTKAYGMADFEPYAPSNNEPAAFIAQPYIKNGKTQLIVALQLSLDAINAIMTQRDGMGETGETYLVGPDKLMRSDSFLDPDHHTVKTSFADPDKGLVDTNAARAALAGETGSGIMEDYNGNLVLSSYTPVKLDGVTWALLAEIDKAEAFAAVKSMQWLAFVIKAIGVCAIIMVALLITKTIVTPVRGVVTSLTDLSQGEGDLTLRLPVTGNDEIGELADKFNLFMEKLQAMIKDISGGVETLSSSSTELSAISQQMADGSQQVAEKSNMVATASEEMSTNMNSVSAAMEQSSTNASMVASASEEMSSTINEIAQSAEKARSISDQAVAKVGESNEQMNTMGQAANAIGKVVETITDISEQVNLLALNATIEAARAGEAGKGFAVVANEIKDLAKQTSDATQDIKDKISNIQDSSNGTLESIHEIERVIAEVNDIVATIASSVEEQSSATSEIAENIGQASTGIQEVNENVTQSSAVAKNITQEISEINQSSGEMATSSDQVRTSAEELSVLAEQLNGMVGRFRV